MSYQVLARKWRPKSFTEMVGQAHVVRALGNALEQGRLHHAYLFTGTRGVGKTTLARILAKSLNCEQGVTATPCGECGACTAIDAGRFVDLIEVDAASRTKVDQTRELLEQVPFAPVNGRYKVYLIDEVHMFSDSSFNALLKTLEEPPPHVKFLLATTDPQKVPVTVLSRCLQFNLKRLPVDQIAAQLAHIAEAESVTADREALALLAQAADGSMRDGLSLFDQAIAYGGGEVGGSDVRAMLGVVAGEKLPDLLRSIQHGDGEAVLGQVAALAEHAPDFESLLKELLALLHGVAVLQAVPDGGDRGAVPEAVFQGLVELLTPEDVQLYYQIGQLGLRDLPFAPDPRAGFEMILLRMLAFRPGTGGAETAASGPQPVTASPATPRRSEAAGAVADRGTASRSGAGETAGGEPDFSDWHATVARLSLGGMAAQLAQHCSVAGWDGRRLSLQLAPQHAAGLLGSRAEEGLREALRASAGAGVEIKFVVTDPAAETPAQRGAREAEEARREAVAAMAADPLVREMGEVLGAELKEDSVRPVGDN